MLPSHTRSTIQRRSRSSAPSTASVSCARRASVYFAHFRQPHLANGLATLLQGLLVLGHVNECHGC